MSQTAFRELTEFIGGTEVRQRQLLAYRKRIRIDPRYFVKSAIGDDIEDYQERIMISVRDNSITTVRSCHDIGKSFTASRTALHFLEANPDCIVVTTAPTFRQVEEIIWREMRGAHAKAEKLIPLGGKMLKTKFDLSEEWFAIGVSSDDANKVQGFHPKSGKILVIVDEAAGVSEDIFVAIDALMTSQGAHVLYIGNPTSVGGTFHKSHHSDPTAHKIHVSCFDTPNFQNNGIRTIADLAKCDLSKVEIVKPWLITPAWAKDKITRWGIDSPMFQARVLGEFPSAEENTLIPLNLVEAAAMPEKRLEVSDGRPYLGVDVARYGMDKTVIAPRRGGIVDPLIIHGKENTTVTTGRVKMYIAENGPQEGIFVDSDGVGGGVADMLQDDKVPGVMELYNGSAAVPEDGGLTFVNLRSQLYWHFAELIKAGKVSLPDDPDLVAQLSSIRYFVTRRGIMVELKDDMKKRLKVSPDRADAVVYAFADFMFATTTNVRPSVGKSYDEMYNSENGY